MPSAPLLKVRSTGRRKEIRESSSAAKTTTTNVPGASVRPNGISRTLSQLAMSKKHKTNGTVKNGAISKHTKKVENGHSRQRRSDTKAFTFPLQIGTATLVLVAAILFIQTDLLKLWGNHQKVSNNTDPSISKSSSSSDPVNKRSKTWRKVSQEDTRRFGSSICNIDRIESTALTSKHFEEVYRYKKPVIVKFPNGAKDWTNPKKWSLKSLTKEYGEWYVMSGNSREIVRRGGNGDVETSFSEYVDRLMDDKNDGEPFYIFDRAFYNDSSLPRTLKPPQYFNIQDGVDDSIFFLGASGSGVTFHKHADAWNGVIYGQKRWFLYPTSHTPPGGVHPGYTQMEWYKTVYPNLKGDDLPMECVQQPGEILYLPEGTYHGTINLGDTVAIGIQKKEASIETEKLFYEELQVERTLGRANQEQVIKRKVEIYERLLELLPGNTEVLMKSGQMFSDSGRMEEGLRNTQAAIDKDPYFLIAKLNKAKTLMQMNQYTEAEKILKDLLQLNPKLWDIHATYGDFLMRQRRYSEAVTMFKEGTKLKPDMIPFWVHLGYAQEHSGDKKGAMETRHKIKELEKDKNRQG